MTSPLLSNEDWLAVEREYCKRSPANFLKRAWPVLENDPYKHGWHVDAICEHLQAISVGQLNRLVINVPPGTMKSTTSAVFWPAWEWGPFAAPGTRIIGASHEQSLAVRDSLKMRRLVTSDWYRSLWPEVELTSDQNEKMFYENTNMGFRQACAVKSMTGRRGHRVIWDDPHSVESALSDADRNVALRVFSETLTTRLTDPETSAIIIIMQRLHENDVTGHIITEGLDYCHLRLPMEYEKDNPCRTIIGFKDPRKEEGELLFPARFPREVVDRDKKQMGSMAVAGQFQQRPSPRSGGFFEWEKLEIVRAVPRMVAIVRYWDKAGTQDGGKRTAGVKIGRGVDGLFYILHVEKGQWNAANREKVIKNTAMADGVEVEVWVEQEPGSGGKESAENTTINLAGFRIYTDRVTGDKAVRAEPYSIQVEAGNVKILLADWNQDFIDEHKNFPVGTFKDQIDAVAGGFNKIALGTYNLDAWGSPDGQPE